MARVRSYFIPYYRFAGVVFAPDTVEMEVRIYLCRYAACTCRMVEINESSTNQTNRPSGYDAFLPASRAQDA